MKSLLMIVMLLVFGFLPKQAQPCNGPGHWSAEWITKHDEVQKSEKQERMLRVEEGNKTKAGGLFHLQKKRIKFNQELSGSSIYKEERILRVMEEKEIPA